MIGLSDYSGKPKESWRGWQWNRVVERLTVPVGKATVLYLCGPDDIDRRTALIKGFASNNLVAIDIKESNVERVRKHGGIGISGQLEDILLAWPSDWKIDAVIADTCYTLSNRMLRLALAMAWSDGIDASTVVAVNMQRGRDSDSNAIRSELIERQAHPVPVVGSLFSFKEDSTARIFNDAAKDWKHRGKTLAVTTLLAASTSASRVTGEESLLPEIVNCASPVFASYRGAKNLYMDSVVMRFTCQPMRYCDGWNREKNSLFSSERRKQAAKRKIAALRAIRTMKNK